jgi:hypothetical protein
MPEVDRFMVADLGIWGNLVKTWATGTDHVGDGKDYLKPPTTITELKDQLTKAGAGPIVPDRYKKLTIVQSTADTLVITLPEAKPLIAAENDIKNLGLGYAPAPFYMDKFQAQPRDPAEPVEGKLLIHAMSIGDYTIRNCK